MVLDIGGEGAGSGAGTWQTIAQGNSDHLPSLDLESESFYRLTMNLPITIPSWLSGRLSGAVTDVLGRFGVKGTVNIGENVIIVLIQT